MEIYKDHCLSFFFVHEERVKEIWDFRINWNWCKMKILVFLLPSVKITYLEIFMFSGNARKRKQKSLKMCLVLDLGKFAAFGEECYF